MDEKRDRMIAEHVLRMHRYLAPGVEEGTPAYDILSQPLSIDAPTTSEAAEEGETNPFEKYNPLLHIGIVGSKSRTRKGTEKKKEILSIAFVKKYIQYAKSKPAPALTKGAADHIVQVYATLRNEEQEGNRKKACPSFLLLTSFIPTYLFIQTSPLTARTLETLIRLATAHAKSRLSPKVAVGDAKAAEEIMRFALFKEVLKRQKRKKRKLNTGEAAGGRGGGDEETEGEESDEDAEGEDDDQIPERMSMPSPAKAKGKVKDVPKTAWEGMDDDVQMGAGVPAAAEDGPTEDGKIGNQRSGLLLILPTI